MWKTDFGTDTPVEERDDEDSLVDMEEDDDEVSGGDDDSEGMDIAITQDERRDLSSKSRAPPPKPAEMAPKEESDEGEDDMGLFEEEDAGQGDEFLSVQPWKNQIQEPAGWEQSDKRQREKPFIKASLEWVHGYRARDSKNNLAIMADGSVAYHAAAVGILYDKNTHSQRHFIAHQDDITAMAFHPDGKRIVTGEIGPRPLICLWDAMTNEEVVKVNSKLKKGIQSLSFSPSGKYFVAVAIDINHHIGIFDTESGAMLAM